MHRIYILFFLLCALSARAKLLYITQSGSGNALSLVNSGSVTWFNTSSNWGAGSGQISPGDTVILHGLLTSTLTVQASGTLGHITTLLFDSGASMQASVWPASTGAINLNGKNYITIDGGATGIIGGPDGNAALANGYIENTANGSSPLAHQSTSIFIYGADSSNITVQNLGLYNLYVRTSTTDVNANIIGSSRDTSAIAAFYDGGSAPSNWKVTNCLIHDAQVGFFITYKNGSSNFEYSFCTAYNCNWGGNAGDYDSSATLSGLYVHDNYFHDWANWDDTSGIIAPDTEFHHNGFFAWAAHGGTASGVQYYNNLIGPNFGADASSGVFVQGWVSDAIAYNNILVENSGDYPKDGLVYFNPYPDIVGTYSVYNNTCIGGGSGIGVNCGPDVVGAHTSQSAQTFNIKNNLLSGVATAIALYEMTGSPIAVNADYNLGYNLNSSEQYSYSATSSSVFKTFSQWQGLGFDAHGVSSNPLLDSNYAPESGSPTFAAASNLTSIFTIDYLGNTRPATGLWTIGACAYQDTSPTVVGVGTKGCASSHQTTTITITPMAGDLLVLGMSSFSGDYAQHAVSDGVNTWTRVAGVNASNTWSTQSSLWYAKNCAGGATTITIDAGSGGTSNDISGTVLELAGASTTAPFTTGESDTKGSSTVTNNPQTNSATNATGPSLFIAYTGSDGGDLSINGTGTTTGSWSLFDTTNSQNLSSGAGMMFSMPYLAVSTSAAQTHGWSNSQSRTYGAIIAAFHADPPPPTVIGVGTKGCASSHQTTTITITPTAGDLLVLGMSSFSGDYAQHTVSDGVNTWTRVAGINASNTWSTQSSLWYAKNCAGGATTITIDAGSGGTSNEISGTVLEVAGASTTAPFTTGENDTKASSTVTNNPQTNSATNATGPSLFIAYTGSDGGDLSINGTGTTTGSWSLFDTTNSQNLSSGAGMMFSMPYLPVSTSAAQTHGWSNSQNRTYGAIIAAFHP